MLDVIFANPEVSIWIIDKREFQKRECVESLTHTQLIYP